MKPVAKVDVLVSMPRRSRQDFPGSWHHVMNRGQAHRPVFLSKLEIRYFLSRLAREVHKQQIEVHGYTLVTTHFHLLLRSPGGCLSDVMMRVENAFVRWFNRRHQRDGSLFRGRFTSRVIESDFYRWNVRCYIDQNPVHAGMVSVATDYPHGSARWNHLGHGPSWLSLRPKFANDSDSLAGDEALNEHASWVIERRLERQTPKDPLDDLLQAAPTGVRRWLERQARVADGPRAPHCLMSPAALRTSISELREALGEWRVQPGRRETDGWNALELGLSLEVVGLSTPEAAVLMNVPRGTVGQSLVIHRKLLLVDNEYGERAARVLQRGVEFTFGASHRDAPLV